MKKIAILIVLASVMLSNCSSNNDTIIQLEDETELTQNEKNDLSFLREEEKLARDVYLYAFEKQQTQIFKNISESEQTHMNSVLSLMTKYGIPDSASKEVGVFNNKELQELYNILTAKSDISLIDALTVGALIEDLDIDDIDDFIANSSNEDVLSVYNNLSCGSKNHIRAYTKQLNNNNTTYVPEYISKTYYDSILSESSGGCTK